MTRRVRTLLVGKPERVEVARKFFCLLAVEVFAVVELRLDVELLLLRQSSLTRPQIIRLLDRRCTVDMRKSVPCL